MPTLDAIVAACPPDASRARLDESAPLPCALVATGTAWVTVHSRRDPLAEARRWAAGIPDDLPVVVVIGLGLGYLLDALDERGWPGRVVAVEPEPALVPLFWNRRDWSPWSSRLTLAVVSDGRPPASLWRALDGLASPPDPLVNPVLARVVPGRVAAARAHVDRAWFEHVANDSARRDNAGRYLLNTLRNARAIVGGGDVRALGGLGRGVPAIVVGAGPSLDRNLDDIARYRDRALVIAVDTAVRPLAAAGAAPDIAVALDPTEANARHLVELPACPATCLVAEGSLDPEGLVAFRGRTAFFSVADHHPWPWLRGQGVDRGPLRAWGSVLTAAFDLALAMGCDPIVFAGADLAFTDGRPYARGTTFEEDWQRDAAWGQPLAATWSAAVASWAEVVEAGVDGAPVRTAPHLRSFRDWLATEAERATDRLIANASGAGILVGPAIRQTTLPALLDQAARLDAALGNALRAACRPAGPQSGTFELPPPGDDTVRAWSAATGASTGAIIEATRPAAPSSLPAARPEPPADAMGLSARDADYLAAVAPPERRRVLTLADASQDLLAELRALARDIPAGTSIVVIDTVPGSCGSQVRRAVDQLLCEDNDIWLEDRRFVDRTSRLVVLRGDARARSRPAPDADRAKWAPDHRDVAEALAPVIAAELAPASVVDVGCGAGYWVDALARLGVGTVAGVTPRIDGGTGFPGVVRAPLQALPDLGRAYDVCLCLEVAQELAPDLQDGLIAGCTRLADTVVFSSRMPGFPGHGPHDRPMPYWAAKFWTHGYVADDSLRQAFEHRWGPPRSVFEGALVFRRRFSPEQAQDPALRALALEGAARAYDGWVQGIWWAIRCLDRVAPVAGATTWTVPAARLASGNSRVRVFHFRSDAARWYLCDAMAPVHVLEDGRPLRQRDSAADLDGTPDGGWVRSRDAISVKASDGSDPRTNGRRYELVVPPHVAAAEAARPGAEGAPGMPATPGSPR
ncbi:MAG: 6-hydroxymethylpterin diphosphokinase MptE-like protein [Vicinamibacterales bacterium]